MYTKSLYAVFQNCPAIVSHYTSQDVDGLHPMNVAALSTGHTTPNVKGPLSWQFEDIDFHIACTPQGCIELLDRRYAYNISPLFAG